MTWGNLGVTSFLLASRVAWFMMVGIKGAETPNKVK